MKRLLPLIVVSVLVIPTIALALNIQPADFYSDVRVTSPEAVGISLLTREGILKGYSSRIFGPARLINRAEFLKIAMLTASREYPFVKAQTNCFPDVRSSDWFSSYVCPAKMRGIVSGKWMPDRFNGRAYFDPSETVTYGEALKILTNLFEYSLQGTRASDAHWAEESYRAAAERTVDLPITIDLDRPLTRGLAARLAAAFLVEGEGQLQEFRMAEKGQFFSSSFASSRSSSSFSSRARSSSSSSLSSSTSSSRSSSPSGQTDPRNDTQVRSQFLLLGEVSPIIGVANFYSEHEPLHVTSIGVNLLSPLPSVQSLLVYDDTRRLLGRATLDPSITTDRHYRLHLTQGVWDLLHRENRKVYFRADTKHRDSGGQGNETLQIANVVLYADGVWSNSDYTQQSSVSDIFPIFTTARSTITAIRNGLSPTGALSVGTNKLLGSFVFEGRKSDGQAKINLTNLTFQIEETGGVSLTNVYLAMPGFSDRHNCTVTSTQVTCTGIPETFGSLTDASRTLSLSGDIAAVSMTSASLRLTLNESGNGTTAGSVSWNDGTTTFSWVPLDAPVASGTLWKY